MKVLSIGSGLVLREISRTIDRNLDTATFNLRVEIEYGTVATAIAAKKCVERSIYVNAQHDASRWAAMKDLSQQGFVEYMGTVGNVLFQQYQAFKQSAPAAEIPHEKWDKDVLSFGGLFDALLSISVSDLVLKELVE